MADIGHSFEWRGMERDVVQKFITKQNRSNTFNTISDEEFGCAAASFFIGITKKFNKLCTGSSIFSIFQLTFISESSPYRAI